MGLFDFFKTNKKPKATDTDNGVLGPTYLEQYAEHIKNPENLISGEWRRVMANNGNKKFRIKYYGQLHEIHKDLIVGTDFSKPLIYAIDILTNQEILLWDGCRFGYDPIFCEDYTTEQINNRKAETTYIDKKGKDIFEIQISTYNQIDFEEEMGDEIDENGCLKLPNGQSITLEDAKRNGFDCLSILIKNEDGKVTEIVSEELA